MGEFVPVVVYTGEPDELFEFVTEGQGRFFGRDDHVCDIVIWSAINGTELSRIAGRIWRMDDELWVRNVSLTHELHVTGAVGPPEPPLPPRRDDVPDPGPARSIPGPTAMITGPGGCELLVRQLSRRDFPVPSARIGTSTVSLPPVPPELRPVAAALCEPLLLGGQFPAAYSEVTRRAQTGSLKRSRTLVGQLCALYVAEVPTLVERAGEPIADRVGGPALNPRLQAGVWTFDPPSDELDHRDAVGRHSLTLPDYYEVAHLLVRRRLVTARDVERLERQSV